MVVVGSNTSEIHNNARLRIVYTEGDCGTCLCHVQRAYELPNDYVGRMVGDEICSLCLCDSD
ncbi:hypothetical protein KSF78_0007753 [Schistosoma japonicum]|nr:hypothetical protein KSF78_0007748 [Schistosoma japonicum]KAH8862227.1 hypothetical protein KSF78_0007753 [Schistosoma japonicum]